MNYLIRRRFGLKNNVTFFHGDCLKLLSNIPSGTTQLIITSPPYNLGKAYERKCSLQEYLSFQQNVINECIRILKKGGSICWQVGHFIQRNGQVIPLDIIFHQLFQKYEDKSELILRNRIIWHFEHGLHCNKRFSGRHETILWYTKGDDYFFDLDPVRVKQKYPGKKAYKGPQKGKYSGNPKGKNPGDVWIFPNVKHNHIEKTEHPCQFPIELPERLILALSQKNDLVVDPFIGVGTTAVAAVIHQRRIAGADIVKDYLEIAEKRIRKAISGSLPIRPREKPVYIPPPGCPLTIRI